MYHSATISSSHSGASTSSGGHHPTPKKSVPLSMRLSAPSLHARVPSSTPIISAQTGDLFFAQNGSIHPSSANLKNQQQRLVAQSGVIVTQNGTRIDKQQPKHRSNSQVHHINSSVHHHGSFFKPSGDQITTFDASHFVFPKSRDVLAKKRRPPLRRYNSDESHNMFFSLTSSSASGSADNSPMSTNERLTCANINIKKPLSKISGSLSSCSASSMTPDTSPESTEMRPRRPEYDIREFLERYSLPRVVKIVGDGRPVLVYKFIEEYVNVLARPIVGKKGREKIDASVLYFPDAYQGWFSLTNDKGDKTAVAHTSLLQLVQEQVYTFLSTTSITAYAAKNADTDIQPSGLKSSFLSGNLNNNKIISQHKSQYMKCTLHPGQVFKLRAVFQHNDRDDVDNVKSSKTRRERDLANRYAQLIDEKNQELYVPLTTKGEFYEISASPRPKLILPGQDEKERPRNPLFVDKDCIYRLGYLLKKCSLPIKLRLLAGPVPEGYQKDFTDLYLFERKVSEPVLLTCSLVNDIPELTCLGLEGVRVARTLLGHDTERTLFASARLQSALSYLRAHSDSWRRRVRPENEWTNFKRKLRGCGSTEQNEETRNFVGIKYCDCPPGECTNNCRNLNEMISSVTHNNKIKTEIQPVSKPSKWLRHFKLGGSTEPEKVQTEPELSPEDRRKSLDRYKDMSKLIEERFGMRRKKTSNPVKKSASFMFALKRTDIDGIGPVTQASKSHSSLMQNSTTESEPTNSATKSNIVSRLVNVSSDAIPEEDTQPDIGLDLKICDIDENTKLVQKPYGRSLNDVTDIKSKPTRGYTCSLKDLTDEHTRPDLIPYTDTKTLSEESISESRRCENSFITDRLCSEFHVKTKNIIRPGKLLSKRDIFVPPKKEFKRKEKPDDKKGTKDIAKLQSRALPVIEDLPYSSAIDALDELKTAKTDTENIYAEICEDSENEKKEVKCGYVKLDSVNEEDVIYNTLR